MLGGRALIVGAARDCAVGLLPTLQRLEKLKQTFDEVRFVFITNDCRDETELVLADWASDKTNVELINLDHLSNNAPQRTARLAIIRNICLSKLSRQGKLPDDYFVVADLDGVNAGLVDEPGLSVAIANAPVDWCGLFANQRTHYYDVWALRHDEWCPGDCWQEVRNASKGIFRRKARGRRAVLKYVKQRQAHIPKDTPPIRVDSAFGGFGLYRVSCIQEAFYVGLTEDGREICEHVSFNKMISSNDGALYVLPELLNDAPSGHV
ncbi:hypothetical protein ACTJK5_02885 [Agrobacterium sp. 22094]|uniref:Uncharacterized protein n=2 Tax=Rhizobium rhizogenes TaxID=359 RepID=A0AA92HAT7_RHIRH|nr:hypothetical protein DC430_03335 [Rhizobium rhizogenes]PVE68678.1 hypothetical protein DC415_02890 [Agrobacterium tumefaciens]PVE78426.1 hypothetical protein DCP16_02890 [Sphingomonas sp. TPD3009]